MNLLADIDKSESSTDKCDEQNSGLNSHKNNSNNNNNNNNNSDNKSNSMESIDKVDGCCLDESSVDPDHLTTGAHLTRQISNESSENTML